MFYFSAFQLLSPSFAITVGVSGELTGVSPLLYLPSHFSITDFFFWQPSWSTNTPVNCDVWLLYKPQVPALFWHRIKYPFVVAAFSWALKETGFRFTICWWQTGTRPLEPLIWWHSIYVLMIKTDIVLISVPLVGRTDPWGRIVGSHVLAQNSVFCLIHNVHCDLDTADAGGRENNRHRVELESE